MSRLVRALLGVLGCGVLLLGPAAATGAAAGVTSGDGINICGNSVTVIGWGNDAEGNECSNGEKS
ncbi:chaplin [Streptomyces coeruleoprunus]|uniref:Chaplin n=1 Tax=Streptomyces coeruleoprunus TaxID=285563 RepID=A0ABV9X7U6_9ACTN